jgi:transketolase
MNHRPPTLPDPLIAELRARARAVRIATVRMAHDGKTPHVGSALSCVDILVALYFRVMHIDPGATNPPDRFVMSKGHGCMAYYATLAERGYFPHALLATYAQNGATLAEHPSPHGIPGVEIATGSLGHGLGIAVGTALARQIDGRPGRAFVLLSDGECNEGSVWETAMFAAGRKLESVIAIVDYNKLQATGRSNEVTGLAPLADKWRAFGWTTDEVDGHDMSELVRLLDSGPPGSGQPRAIVAHTVKRKGVSFMEDDPEWHYRPPTDDDLARAILEIGA